MDREELMNTATQSGRHVGIGFRLSAMRDAIDRPSCLLEASSLRNAPPMKTSIIVWNLETVPDLRGFAVANGLAGKTDGEVRAVIGDTFPKHIYQWIVCIGALVAHREDDHWAIDTLAAPHVGERSERQLISEFVANIAELKPQLITFNGKSIRSRPPAWPSGRTSTGTARTRSTCATRSHLSAQERGQHWTRSAESWG